MFRKFSVRNTQGNFSRNTLRLMVFLAPWVSPVNSYALEATTASAEQVEFDSSFLNTDDRRALDLSRFEKGISVPPGKYSVDLYVNADWVGRTEVTFRAGSNADSGEGAQACFDKKLLLLVGVNLEKITPENAEKLGEAGSCLPIGSIVVDAGSVFDFGDQRLDLSIPQASLNRKARGYVSPELWDKGVNASFLGYDFNQYRYKTTGQSGSQIFNYLGLSAGTNIGEWHIRHNGTYNWSSGDKAKYQSLATYAQRSLPSLSSELTIGEAFTTGELFDSTQFRGVRVATDDRMWPDSLRGYAPTVRGVANSNARVVVKQNGFNIYESTVAPGAFEINDLYSTGYGGDLSVLVTEADGSEHSFTIPYAAVPLSLRPGSNRYSLSAGTVRDPQLSSSPAFTQATWQYGLSNLLTGYTGFNASQGYKAFLVGGAFNTSLGAFGLDVTQASTELSGRGQMNGRSVRASYAKRLTETGTDVAIAAYRYSTGGYFDLNNAVSLRDQLRENQDFNSVLRQRDRAQLTLSQRLGDTGGYLSLTSSSANYWNRSGRDMNYSLAYSNNYQRVNYSFQATRERNMQSSMNTQYYFSVTVPFGRENPFTISSSVSHDTNGRTQSQATLSGSAGDSNNLSYGLTGNRVSDKNSRTNGGSANVMYRGPSAELWGSVGEGTGYSQNSIGARGAVVAHQGGITLAQPLSETFGIVEALDAQDAKLVSSAGVKVDSRGYAIVPYLTPYNMNAIDLDPKGMTTDVELKVSSQQVAPYAGSVPFIKFATASGRAVVIRVKQSDGSPLPFGAAVLDEGNIEVGLVGQAGKIFARGLQDQGILTVKWGEDALSICRIPYVLPERDRNKKNDYYQQIDASCLVSQ